MSSKKGIKNTETKEFTLVAYSKFGGIYNVAKYPNKTRAISQGRDIKRNGLCASYQVYDNRGAVIHKG